MKLSTGGGGISVSVPGTAAFNLDARTSGGGVTTDLAVAVAGRSRGATCTARSTAAANPSVAQRRREHPPEEAIGLETRCRLGLHDEAVTCPD